MANIKNNEDLKNKLAERAVVDSPRKPEQVIKDLLKRMAPEVQKALPKHMDADRLLRITLTNMRLNPKLLQCNQASLLAAIMQSAQLGLEPGLLGMSYLIPYENRKMGTVECQFQIGYKGYLELLRRTGEVSIIEAHSVYEKDEFDFQYGIEPKLFHKPNMSESRGEAYCYYAIVTLKDGSKTFLVMGKENINRIRDKYSKAKNYGPWAEEYDAMAKKTVLKQLIKYLPLSVEVMKNIAQDETTKHEIKEDMTEVLDIEYLGKENVEDVKYNEIPNNGVEIQASQGYDVY